MHGPVAIQATPPHTSSQASRQDAWSFRSGPEDRRYLSVDAFGGRGYVPFETTGLNSGRWTASRDYDLPSGPRHGSVTPVTRAGQPPGPMAGTSSVACWSRVTTREGLHQFGLLAAAPRPGA